MIGSDPLEAPPGRPRRRVTAYRPAMSPDDPPAACDRLALIFERASALEEEGRLATDDTVHAPVVPFAIAQLRMRVLPALSPHWASGPVHVVLLGGTNS